MNELISVLLPVYNGEKYLSEAIESILNQTYANFEFIIIDDGSKDKSLEIINKYADIDNRIIVRSRENRGLIATLNEGIEIAKGKYIARMDQDDISLAERFQEQVEFMEKNTAIGVCGTWVEVFGQNRKDTLWKLPSTDEEIKPRLLFSVTFAHPSVMIRKSILDNNKLYYNEDYNAIEDYKMWLDCSKFTEFANIPKVLLKYRYLDTSLSKTADSAKDDSRYISTKKVFRQVLENLKLDNIDEENRLHFLIGFNERIAKADIDLKFLNVYLNKLIEANQNTKVFNEKYLEQFLAKKFLIVVYFKIKNKDLSFLDAVFFRLFWKASFDIFIGRLK